jgi:chemotaxis protein methyltransferase CheR
MKINPREHQLIAKYVYEQCGIVLDESKAYLLESRLTPLAEELDCASFADLYTKIISDRTKKLTNRLIDAMSTNETSFFRDQKPFDLFRFKIIPDLIDRLEQSPLPSKAINIWSSACSTGQEVYTIAICLHEILGAGISKYRIKIVGTDIADSAIVQASRANYSQFEIGRGMPDNLLRKYFVQDGSNWRVKDELRSMAFFRKQNLMESFSLLGKFDIVFCRNVAIYFSMEDRKSLFSRIADQISPGGVLLIGSTESLYGVSDRYERCEYHNSIFFQVK